MPNPPGKLAAPRVTPVPSRIRILAGLNAVLGVFGLLFFALTLFLLLAIYLLIQMRGGGGSQNAGMMGGGMLVLVFLAWSVIQAVTTVPISLGLLWTSRQMFHDAARGSRHQQWFVVLLTVAVAGLGIYLCLVQREPGFYIPFGFCIGLYGASSLAILRKYVLAAIVGLTLLLPIPVIVATW
jgi:hypothetical protein